MIVSLILGIFLFAYIAVVTVIIRQSNKQSGIVIFSPPENAEQAPAKNESHQTRNIPPHTDNIYLNAIAGFLVGQKEEIPKIVKFVDSLPDQKDCDFILDYLHYYDQRLYDHVVALRGIDTSNIENFRSQDIEVEDSGIQLPADYSVLTPEECLMVGGIPEDLLLENIDVSDVTNSVEYYDRLNTMYIARVLNDPEIQEIEKQAQKIIEPITSSIPSPALQKIFREGNKVAKEIIRELEQKDEDKIL